MTEIEQALKMVFKNPYHSLKKASSHIQLQRIPAGYLSSCDTFQTVIKRFSSKKKGFVIARRKSHSYASRLGEHEFSCGMKMQKGTYTVVEKLKVSQSLQQRFWITSIFTVPLVILMIGMSTGGES